jgi:hypothetical protein
MEKPDPRIRVPIPGIEKIHGSIYHYLVLKSIQWNWFSKSFVRISLFVMRWLKVHSQRPVISYLTPGCNDKIQMVHWSNVHEASWGEVRENRSLWMNFYVAS